MANIIEIITREIVEGKGNIAGVGKELDTVQEKANDVNSGQRSLADTFKGSWTEISSMLNVGAQAIKLVGEAYSEVVGTYIDYAAQVRTISQVTGQQAEDVSRLLQVTDDYKIDSEKLTQVMKKMATEGFAFTTDSLADLSDAYLEIQDPVERTNFLFETFGREGEAFAEVMLQGGDAIREQSDAISENLILTEKSLQQARDYEIATDNLNDAMEGLKIQIGKGLVPPMTDLLNATTAAITDFEWLSDLLSGDFKGSTEAAAAALIAVGFVDAAKDAEKFKIAIAEATVETQNFAAMANTTVTGAQMLDTQNKKLADSITAMKDAEIAYVNYKTANPLDTAGIQAMRDKWVGLAGNVKDVQDANDLQTKAWLANILLQQLSLGPEGLSGAEMAFYLQYMENSGLMTEESRIKTEKMYNDMVTMAGGFTTAANEAERITSGLKGIPKEVSSEVNIHTNYTSSGYSGSQGSQIPIATGRGIPEGSMLYDGAFADGGGFGGGNYLWNESAQSRPEVFVGGGGYVLTKQDAMNALGMGGGGGAMVVINYSPMFSMGDRAEMETVLIPLLKEQLGL